PRASGGPPSTARAGPAPRKARGPFDLAPGGVYRATAVTCDAGGLLHHRFTLARAWPKPGLGGLFSVALSRGSPRVGVTDHPALWSLDLPHQAMTGLARPPGRLALLSKDRRSGPGSKASGATGRLTTSRACRCAALGPCR